MVGSGHLNRSIWKPLNRSSLELIHSLSGYPLTFQSPCRLVLCFVAYSDELTRNYRCQCYCIRTSATSRSPIFLTLQLKDTKINAHHLFIACLYFQMFYSWACWEDSEWRKKVMRAESFLFTILLPFVFSLLRVRLLQSKKLRSKAQFEDFLVTPRTACFIH